MKLQAILREVTANRDREMVTGVAEILRQVKDQANREQIAKRMIKKFDREGVKYDEKQFMKMCDLKAMSERRSLEEIGEATAAPYRLDQSVREDDLDQYEFTTDTGNQYAILIDKETDDIETDYDVAFGLVRVPEEEDPENAFYNPMDMEKEVNDPKNLFRVMATVVSAVKRSIYRDELSGLRVTRIIMNPTKKDKSDTRRTQLYKKYIEKHMPEGSNVYIAPDGGRIQIELPRT